MAKILLELDTDTKSLQSFPESHSFAIKKELNIPTLLQSNYAALIQQCAENKMIIICFWKKINIIHLPVSSDFCSESVYNEHHEHQSPAPK